MGLFWQAQVSKSDVEATARAFAASTSVDTAAVLNAGKPNVIPSVDRIVFGVVLFVLFCGVGIATECFSLDTSTSALWDLAKSFGTAILGWIAGEGLGTQSGANPTTVD